MSCTIRHLSPWFHAALLATAIALAGCATPPPKEPRVVCNTEHGLSFSTRYDNGKIKCVTDKRDEGEIYASSLSKGGNEHFYLRLYARNKKNPSEQIKDVTPESFIKQIEDGYARGGKTKLPYRLKNEEETTVQLSGRNATLRERHLVINGYDRTLSYLFFNNETFDFVAVLTTNGNWKTNSMMQEVIAGLSVK